jgi:fatty acid desaturase
VTLSELHSIVPKHLWRKSTFKGLSYVARDVVCAVLVYKLGWKIEPLVAYTISHFGVPHYLGLLLKWTLWGLYWHFQGVILAGWWCLAHEAGHGTISSYGWVNHVVGFVLHTVRIARRRLLQRLTSP